MAELKMDNRRYFFSFGPAQRAEEAWPSVVDGDIGVLNTFSEEVTFYLRSFDTEFLLL